MTNIQTFYGADISDYQDGYNAKEYARHQEFLIVKATEGLTVNDRYFAARRAAYKEGNLLGIYHFAHPAHNSATAEANHFLRTIGGKLRNGEWPLLDLEVNEEKDGKKLSNTELHAWVNTWTTIVGKKLGIRGGIYSYYSFLKEHSLPASSVNGWFCHVANYSATTGTPPPWKKWTMWQFTGDGEGPQPHQLRGISDKNIDVNKFVGTIEELRALGKGYKAPDQRLLDLSKKELAWVTEYRQLKHLNQNRARRVLLRARMRAQAALIKRLALSKGKYGGWTIRHRKNRYAVLNGASS